MPPYPSQTCYLHGCPKTRPEKGKYCTGHQYRVDKYGMSGLIIPLGDPRMRVKDADMALCLQCREEMPARKRKGGLRTFCSAQCSRDFAGANRVMTTCGWCGTDFYTRGKKRTYCTIECNNKSRLPGSRHLTDSGYVIWVEYNHPSASASGVVREHRAVMADMIGRPLRENETVHHKNGVRSDNRPENLELWVKSQPSGQRIADLVQHAGHILREYGHLVD